MELYQLRAFLAVADEGHLTRAAERLHVSQPAVSSQIKALEDAFDARLFERTSSGMVLTVPGRELLQHARRTVAAADELMRAARALKGEIAGRLRIGTLADPALIRLGDILGRSIKRHPLLELELHHEISGAAAEGVREGRLDASFYFGDPPGTDLNAIALKDITYLVCAPTSWQSRVDHADWRTIAAMPWVLTPAISTHSRLVNALFASEGVNPPEFHVEADHESVIENLVMAGVGLSLLREDIALARERSGDVCIWPQARLQTRLWFVHARRQARNPLIMALVGLVRETWPDALSTKGAPAATGVKAVAAKRSNRAA